MSKIKEIEECICGEMPIVLTHNCIGFVEYCAKYPKCGRGGIFYPTMKTTYQALKKWNDMQQRIKGENDERI